MMNELYGILADLRDDGVTIVLVDQLAALAIADRGCALGRIVRADTATAPAEDPALEPAGPGHAQAAQ